MKYLKLPALLLAAVSMLFTFSSCDDGGLCLKGDGEVESRNLDLRPIRGVEVGAGTKVFIQRGDKQQVEVRGQANILNELDMEVRDGIWEIDFERCLRDYVTVEVYITVPELEKANVGGSGQIELRDVFKSRTFSTSISGSGKILLRLATEELDARISGSGTIRAAGVADVQDVSISGSGKYMASDLESRETKVSISGSGRAEVDADEELNVDVSGSGSVYYTGTPSVNSSVSGSGKVIKR